MPSLDQVLLPCFVCEYTAGGQDYRCFVSGVSGKLVGVSHRGSSIGGGLGAVMGFLGSQAFAMAPVFPNSALFPVWVGVTGIMTIGSAQIGHKLARMGSGGDEDWRMAERARKLNAERHDRELLLWAQPTEEEASWHAELARQRDAEEQLIMLMRDRVLE